MNPFDLILLGLALFALLTAAVLLHVVFRPKKPLVRYRDVATDPRYGDVVLRTGVFYCFMKVQGRGCYEVATSATPHGPWSPAWTDDHSWAVTVAEGAVVAREGKPLEETAATVETPPLPEAERDRQREQIPYRPRDVLRQPGASPELTEDLEDWDRDDRG